MHQTSLWTTYLFMPFWSIFLLGCNQQDKPKFNKLSLNETGIDFANHITETDSLNILNFHYIYNGGGVGIGDFNNDDLPDLVFSGNQVPSKIYLNKGHLNFTDITQTSNFKCEGWATGVSIVDINADGWDDIYISVGGYQCNGNCNNKLFINQGLDNNQVPIFKEQAEIYGLDDGLYTQQAAFFDYDGDGDLDAYLLHNVIDKRDKNVPSNKKFIDARSIDQLLENKDNNTFVDVSDSLGIKHRGYGLGITINDFNNDGRPDIYIANDFLSDDLMYLNLGHKQGNHLGFQEVAKEYLKHTSYNAMGVDVADVNNDLHPDIFVLDMLPAYNERQKTTQGFMNYDKFQLTLRQKYAPQFIRNTLQIHNGFLNDQLIPFSEVSYLSGIYNTDWSWTPLLADFDNDGDRDLFVTNGYGKDITDLDFINYSQKRNPFGTKETQLKELFNMVQQMDPITMPNYIFENEGQLAFTDRSDQWFDKENSISNGAVYSDLDNDGDLDLIVNNLNQNAFIFENTIAEHTKNNFLKIKLKGSYKNPKAIGSSITVWSQGNKQNLFQSPVRGYLSSVDPILHFGLGHTTLIDSIKIIWPDGSTSITRSIDVNQTLHLEYLKTAKETQELALHTSPMFSTNNPFSTFQHQENHWQDFDAQPLLLHQHSKQGPCMLAANIDDRPGDELFIGGAKGFPGQIWFEQEDGQFKITHLPDEASEDVDATFFDVDQDGDLDLYIVSGGTAFAKNAKELEDRLYINNGLGEFTRAEISLPKSSGGVVQVADFDKDGDLDLFIGGRVVPQQFPYTPASSLLINQNGQLAEYSINYSSIFQHLGMISDASWSDVDGDDWLDLVLVGEWMPITILKNNQGEFHESEIIQIPNSEGLWNSIAEGDFDNDGDPDFILGNLGKNSRLTASPSKPLYLLQTDYDGNGSTDPLIGQYYPDKNGKQKVYPLHSRDDVMKQLVLLKDRYVQYAAFGKATFSEILQRDLASADFSTIKQLASVHLENLGNLQFQMKELPQAAQVAPIQGLLVDDFDHNGNLDVLVIGNDYTAEKNNGWYDASNGAFLKGNGDGTFESIPTTKSGFFVPGDGRDIIEWKNTAQESFILASQNSSKIQSFVWQKPSPSTLESKGGSKIISSN